MTKDEALKLALEALEKSTDNFPANVQHKKAITAIKEALAQPAQDFKAVPKEDAPLVKWAKEQKPWVGLTDEELHEICNSYYYGDKELLKLIEAKLKEKNT
jgi:hypothetical protein